MNSKVKRFVFGVALLALLLPATQAQTFSSGRSYECSVKEVAALKEDGSIGPTRWTELISQRFERFTFDEATGAFRWNGDDKVWLYEVHQAGTEDLSLLASRRYQGTAAFVLSRLEIETYQEGATEYPFFLISSEIYSGTCGVF